MRTQQPYVHTIEMLQTCKKKKRPFPCLRFWIRFKSPLLTRVYKRAYFLLLWAAKAHIVGNIYCIDDTNQTGCVAELSGAMVVHPSILILRPTRLFFLKPSLSLLNRTLSINPQRFSVRCNSSITTESLNSDTNETGRSGSRSAPPAAGTQQKIDVNPPRGTRDFPPDEMRLRTWLFNNFREVLCSIVYPKLDKLILNKFVNSFICFGMCVWSDQQSVSFINL